MTEEKLFSETVATEEKPKKRGRKPKKAAETTENVVKKTEARPTLPMQDTFRIDEAAIVFGVSDRDIRLWITHGILTQIPEGGIMKVPRESILKCRFYGKDFGGAG